MSEYSVRSYVRQGYKMWQVLRGDYAIWEAMDGDDTEQRAHLYMAYIRENGIEGLFPISKDGARREKTRAFFAAHPEKSKFPPQQSIKWILDDK